MYLSCKVAPSHLQHSIFYSLKASWIFDLGTRKQGKRNIHLYPNRAASIIDKNVKVPISSIFVAIRAVSSSSVLYGQVMCSTREHTGTCMYPSWDSNNCKLLLYILRQGRLLAHAERITGTADQAKYCHAGLD